jgi:hypothetical protein
MCIPQVHTHTHTHTHTYIHTYAIERIHRDWTSSFHSNFLLTRAKNCRYVTVLQEMQILQFGNRA